MLEMAFILPLWTGATEPPLVDLECRRNPFRILLGRGSNCDWENGQWGVFSVE